MQHVEGGDASLRSIRLALVCAFGTLALLALVAGPAAAQPAGPEFRVNTHTTAFQEGVSVARDPSGASVVVWHSWAQDGSGTAVMGRRFAASGAPLGGEFRVNSYTTGYQSGASVAMDSNGGFVVVWTRDLSTLPSDIMGRRFASDGSPLTSDFVVSTTTSFFQYGPSVALDATGAFVVVWHGGAAPTSFVDVFARRFASTGEPLGTQFRVNTYSYSTQGYPAVAASPAGDFVVVWHSAFQDGGSYGVFGQRYASTGAPAGPEFRVNTQTIDNQQFPSVSFDTAGRFIVVWESVAQDSADSIGVYGQRFSSGGVPLGAEFRANVVTANNQSRPAIASDAAGGFIVAWQSDWQDAHSWGVYARGFRGSGLPVGSEFRVNTYTTSYQLAPSVASDAKGGFVIAWHSNDQDGSYTGVFAQRFLPAGMKGDSNADGVLNVTDVFYMINYIFAGGPGVLAPSDVNADGQINVGDVFYLINYLFAGGPAPH